MYVIEDGLIDLLVSNEEWLMGRVLEYAERFDYLKYSKTSDSSWENKISTLSDSIILAIKSYGITPPELHADDKYCYDPLSLFGINEAAIRQNNNVHLSTVLGLMKYFRQAYFDLVTDKEKDTHRHAKYISFLNRCFDRIELGIITGWNGKFITDTLVHTPHSGKLDQNDIKYQNVFDNMFAPTILLDSQNRIINFNNAASRLFTNIKISAEYYFDDNSFDFAPREIVEGINNLINSIEDKATIELLIDTIEGKRFYNVLLKKNYNKRRHYDGMIITFNDLTHYKEMVQNLENAMVRIEESDHLKTAFLANMSHEIRTPLNAILGFTEVLQHSNHSKKERDEFLGLIRTSSNDLLSIIEDLIDIAKIESKQLKIKQKPCSPYDIVNDLQAVFHEVLKRYGIQDTVKLRVNVKETEKQLIINTDKERLKQVLTNLLNNAAKFTDKGYIEFGFKLNEQSGILFFVHDSGMGIPAEMKDKIFDRFAQVEQNSLKDHRSAGLGLAISKNIINLMGGNIWVESEPDKGSSFYFNLPVMKVPELTNSKELKSDTVINGSGLNWSDKTLVIAEDDELNFIYLNELLKNTKVRILRALNGLDAMKIADTEDLINCILMDIKMPEVNGIEAAQYISRIRPEIPIIALTAFALDGDREKCLNAGCNAYLTKPVRKEALFNLLDKYLHANKAIEMKPTAI